MLEEGLRKVFDRVAGNTAGPLLRAELESSFQGCVGDRLWKIFVSYKYMMIVFRSAASGLFHSEGLRDRI